MGVHEEPPPQNLIKIFLVMTVALFVSGFVTGTELLVPGSETPVTHRLFKGFGMGIGSLAMFSLLCKWFGRR